MCHLRTLSLLLLILVPSLVGIDRIPARQVSAMPASQPAVPAQKDGVWECWNNAVPGLCPGTLMNDFALVSADDIWAVGYHGVMLHWNGKEWSKAYAPTEQALLTVD